jgi:hypothetical protein
MAGRNREESRTGVTVVERLRIRLDNGKTAYITITKGHLDMSDDPATPTEPTDAATEPTQPSTPPAPPPQAFEPIMQYFAYRHLPPTLAIVSAQFAVLAEFIMDNLPRCAERTVALRKLLESKDAAVRAALAR